MGGVCVCPGARGVTCTAGSAGSVLTTVRGWAERGLSAQKAELGTCTRVTGQRRGGPAGRGTRAPGGREGEGSPPSPHQSEVQASIGFPCGLCQGRLLPSAGRRPERQLSVSTLPSPPGTVPVSCFTPRPVCPPCSASPVRLMALQCRPASASRCL